ncbi:hypothetical protein QTP70_029922 [Hemibagrus guttatus]|uniref:Mitoguardin 2 n=1 Tax=Hemibagrus guttatus TaxID=175788 RepID=A0AAE0UXB5_9TELE|nr:hypothetical protein QTP70_029922 [Hemibagrus guttatus]
MSIRQTEGVSIMQALAMTVAEIPVFLYSTFGQSIFSQLRLTPNLKKVLFATALGSVALALTAHHLKRRSRKRKQIAEKAAPKTVGVPEQLLRSGRPTSLKRGPLSGRQMLSPSTRSNDTMSGISSLAASKHSSSSHTSARLPVSPNQSATVASMWEAEPVAEEPGAIEDANAENLYLMGMELFEEALQKWEQALNIRHQTPSNSSANSLTRQGAALTPEARNRKFAEKLESLLHRAYHLQEDFGSTIPAESLLADLAESEGTLILPIVESSHGVRDDDAATITSDDSFFSAAELFDTFTFDEVYQPLKPAALYEEALSLVREGKVECRSLRTDLLECYSDQDFLAKLHCVRQAFHVLLVDETHKNFFMETGKQMINGLMIKANKALATACWSVLKAKRRLLMVPDGFISHFYAISEHVSPVLAFGFLGPRQHLTEVCTIFKQQIVQYLKDMFDHDKVRFTSTQSLAEDILSLSHRRTDILLGYLGINSVPEANGALPASTDTQD